MPLSFPALPRPPLPRLPLPRAATLLRLPPPAPALGLGSLMLTRFMAAIAGRHPALIARMGPEAEKRLLLDATDLPALLLMQPAALALTMHPRRRPPAHDALIRGRLSAFLAMLHGEVDGDALFFAGDLAIEGDTGAVLALRNALDDAELDLTEEFAALTRAPRGPLGRLAAGISARTGLSLARASGANP